ncbi:MAG: hypothetical protein KTR17_08390 [Cellvibrionaceae bacterium]|nr:hypothetical protein [Cellvibrionaceae bacterium]
MNSKTTSSVFIRKAVFRTFKYSSALSLAMLAHSVSASGLDLTGNPIDMIFAEKNEVRLRVARISPNISGEHDRAGFGETGDIGDTFITGTLGVKFDVADNWSFSLEGDRPYYGRVNYRNWAAGRFLGYFDSRSLTGLARYKFNKNWSVFGGARWIALRGELNSFGAKTHLAPSSEVGAVIGGAFEIPEMAIRVSLSYAEEQRHRLEADGSIVAPGEIAPITVSGATGILLPEQIRLDFQTPVSRSTLLFGGIRWSNWSDTDIWPGQDIDEGELSLVDFSDTAVATYSLGATQLITDSFALTGTIGYEEDNNNEVNFLNVLGGFVTYGVAATYIADNYKSTVALTYTPLDDKTGDFFGADLSYESNEIWALGFQLNYTF